MNYLVLKSNHLFFSFSHLMIQSEDPEDSGLQDATETEYIA